MSYELPDSYRPGYFRMDGSRYEGDFLDVMMAWAEDLADHKGRIVGQDLLWNGLWVSTVWLGIPRLSLSPKPLIFETMVFDHLTDSEPIFEAHWATLQEAEEGHRLVCDQCRRLTFTVQHWWQQATQEEES